jgi:hypothetical protein
MSFTRLVGIGLAAVLAFSGGCSTLSGEPLRSVELSVTSDGALHMDGRKTPLEKLPARLKRAGAGAQTSVIIDVPPDLSPGTLKDISRTLVSGGYQRILFKKHPRQAQVFTGPPQTGTRSGTSSATVPPRR